MPLMLRVLHKVFVLLLLRGQRLLLLLHLRRFLLLPAVELVKRAVSFGQIVHELALVRVWRVLKLRVVRLVQAHVLGLRLRRGRQLLALRIQVLRQLVRRVVPSITDHVWLLGDDRRRLHGPVRPLAPLLRHLKHVVLVMVASYMIVVRDWTWLELRRTRHVGDDDGVVRCVVSRYRSLVWRAALKARMLQVIAQERLV